MATIGFTLSDAAIAEVVDAVCALHFYSPIMGDGTANPETRAQFARRIIRAWIIDQVREYRRKQALTTVDPTDPDIT